MAKTLIDLNEQMLEQARKILGTETKKETVNRALEEVVRRHVAAQFLQAIEQGAFVRGRQQMEVADAE